MGKFISECFPHMYMELNIIILIFDCGDRSRLTVLTNSNLIFQEVTELPPKYLPIKESLLVSWRRNIG